MKRVYVSGPYSKPDPCENTNRAIMAGNALVDAGFAPFIPHLSHFWHTVSPRPYGDWMRIDLAFVLVCNAFLRLPGDSPGADIEEAIAKSRGIPIYYSIAELIEAESGA